MDRSNKLLFILSLNLALMFLELFGGIFSRSLALVSDAGHMLTDSLSIFLSWLAFQWSKKPAAGRRTYGYHRVEIIAALVNGLALAGLSTYIFYEAIHRFFNPQVIQTGMMMVIAAIGLIGNAVGLVLLHKDSHENLNVRGAFLHILGDTISSVGVIAAAITIYFTGWNFMDSLVGVIIAGIVMRSAINLLFESGDILLEAAPRDIDIEELTAEVQKIRGVKDFHEIHIWTITSGKRALSAHVLTDNISTRESQDILCSVREFLSNKYNITHCTLEAECDNCENNVCDFQKQGPEKQGPGSSSQGPENQGPGSRGQGPVNNKDTHKNHEHDHKHKKRY
ncbi:MAG: cation diffusion facilitator family transporter [Elusimicrobiota bacterium]